MQAVTDQWLYLMKHMDELDGLRNYWDKRIFSRIFEIGEVANLTPEEKMSYISNLEQQRVYDSTIAYAEKKGRLEERAKAEAEKLAEKKESAKKMLVKGFDIETIADILGLPIEEIEKLK